MAPLATLELLNVVTVVILLFFLFVSLTLLFRNTAILVGDGSTSRMPWNGVPTRPSRILMHRVHIPFTFKLMDVRNTSYDDVVCRISSSVKYERIMWWGAPVAELHHALWSPVRDMLRTDKLSKECQHVTPITECNAHEEKTLHISLKSPLKLGKPPRACYPLVVLLARDPDDTTKLQPDDTVALVTVVHICDDLCPLPSGILAQYLKQANGQLSNLKQLYLTGEEEVGAGAGGSDAYTAGGGGGLCCVCTARPLSRAILPCRHTCLCSACFPKLDKCPICRSPIQSYFCIRAEEEPAAAAAPEAPEHVRKGAGRSGRWLLTWNQRLTDFLGFH